MFTLFRWFENINKLNIILPTTKQKWKEKNQNSNTCDNGLFWIFYQDTYFEPLWLLFSKPNLLIFLPRSLVHIKVNNLVLTTLLIHFQIIWNSIQSCNIEIDLRSPHFWFSPNQLLFANQCHQQVPNIIWITPIKYFGKIQLKVSCGHSVEHLVCINQKSTKLLKSSGF
jgi:hypothetical protein